MQDEGSGTPGRLVMHPEEIEKLAQQRAKKRELLARKKKALVCNGKQKVSRVTSPKQKEKTP
jgi:hypothetical protein